MKSVKITSSQTKIVPQILKKLGLEKEENKLYSTKTNIRIKTHFDIKYDVKNTDLKYVIMFARNQIFRHQYKIPMKTLMPEPGNTYICQKAPFSDKSNDIKNAAKIIEPLNIGFDEYIRYIPINQNLDIDTTFVINVSVPYNSKTRFRFKSNQLVCKDLKEVPFDQNIDIGTLDIGSQYTGKFKVKDVNLNIYDSYTLFSFDITDDDKDNLGFDILTYEFMNVDVKYIFKEIIKIVENKNEEYDDEFNKYKKDCVEFLNKCLESLK